MAAEFDQQNGQRSYHQYDQRGGYDDYDERSQPQYQQRSTILERGRAVRLMRNGDPFFPGRVFVINQKKYPMLEVFLDDASRTLRANFGAVRSVYTPKHGTRLNDISDFEDHCTYVAAGREKFKKLHYLDIAEGKRVVTKTQPSPKIQLPPVRRIDVEGKALKLSRSENLVIYVYRNGDPLTLPAKVLLVRSTLQKWESVLDEVTKKIYLPNSAVLKLYAMNGELITSARQLEYNGMYVAGGKERFKRVDYPDPQLLSPNASPKVSRKSSHNALSDVQPRNRLPLRQKRADDSNVHRYHQPTSSTMQYRYAKSDGAYTQTNTADSYGSMGNPPQRRTAQRDEYDYFNNKPQQHRRGPTKETDLDRDDGGIYKGRTNYRDRAREVDETRDTKVDLPIDYREAETVDDETVYEHNEKNLRRHPQPPQHQQHAEDRQQPLKSQSKYYNDRDNYDDDDGAPVYSHTNSRNNGYEKDYRRTQTPTEGEHTQRSLPNSINRNALISSSTQSNKNAEDSNATNFQSHNSNDLDRKQTHSDPPQQPAFDHNSNIDQHHQSPPQVKKRNSDDDNYRE